MIDIIILIVGFMIAVVLGAWVASKYREKSVYEIFKTIGIKTLSILALINIFNYSNGKLYDNSGDSKQED